ncbi:hypothetical protein JCM10908_001287 [Rhodotorula pacifica]|uniref:uncharacterized protein n=1 Tax=Rhodotorula pacifica TaxID=1495444 RepID=UPI003174E87B
MMHDYTMAVNIQHDHEFEFFAYFPHGLFDVHRFFNTYPANELSRTASLFGHLISSTSSTFNPSVSPSTM